MICCGPACVSFLVLTSEGLISSGVPGGIVIMWDITLEFSTCTVHGAEVCLPVLSQEFCVASLCSSVFLSPKFEWWVGVFLILKVPAVVWDGS